MAKKIASIVLVALLTGWAIVMCLGSFHDTTNHLPPLAQYYWAVILNALVAAIGLWVMIDVIRGAKNRESILLWVVANAVTSCYTVCAFFSLAGSDATPALFLTAPGVCITPVVILLLKPKTVPINVGFVLPILLGIALLLAVITHAVIEPGVNTVPLGANGRGILEVWLPANVTYYLRPISILVFMTIWTATLFRIAMDQLTVDHK